MERAGADLGIVGLHDGATMARPVVLEGEDHVLEGEGLRCHAKVPSRQLTYEAA